METACDVYTRLLCERGYGHPLWFPEPSQAGEVMLGDVGYIDDGGFSRIFNATLPPEDPANHLGVPEGYTPLEYPAYVVKDRPNALSPGPLCSKSVSVTEIGGYVSTSTNAIGGKFRFKCTAEQGAFLVLRRGGHRRQLSRYADISTYILKNHASWCTFARDTLRLDVKDEDVIFVNGWVKTAEWALAAATHNARHSEIEFSGDFGTLARAAFAFNMSRERSMSIEHRSGPLREDGVQMVDEQSPCFDQCVFLRYYKLKRRLLAPKQLQAAAEEYPDERPPKNESHGVLMVQQPDADDSGNDVTPNMKAATFGLSVDFQVEAEVVPTPAYLEVSSKTCTFQSRPRLNYGFGFIDYNPA
ncbi:hypothetical protein C8Q79DRAFT_918179 [Trametes meyenii]|nr:hypothetical protein C8Q79DRAFT_918179 [Trametes meyenii]